MEIVLRYVGDGTYIPGVPARDLRADEAAPFMATIKEYETAMGIQLYAPVETLAAPAALRARRVSVEEVSNG